MEFEKSVVSSYENRSCRRLLVPNALENNPFPLVSLNTSQIVQVKACQMANASHCMTRIYAQTPAQYRPQIEGMAQP